MKGWNASPSLHWYLAIIYNPGAILQDHSDMETERDSQKVLDRNSLDERCDLLEEITLVRKQNTVLRTDQEDQLQYESCEEDRFETVSIGLSNDIQFMHTPEGNNHQPEEPVISSLKEQKEVVELDSDIETDSQSMLVDPIPTAHSAEAPLECIQRSPGPHEVSPIVNVDDDISTMPEASKSEAILPSIRDPKADRPLQVYGKNPKTGKTVLKPGSKASPKNSKKLEEELAQKRKICHIMILDSLNISRSVCIRNLKEFLRMEALHRKKKRVDTKVMKGVNAKIPVQPNHCDCGVYVLQFIETFFNDSKVHRDYILVTLTNKSHKADPDTWFNHTVIVQKRKRIQELIMNLAKEYAHSVDKTSIETIALDDSDDDVQIVQ
jgi:Ulp1 family protease